MKIIIASIIYTFLIIPLLVIGVITYEVLEQLGLTLTFFSYGDGSLLLGVVVFGTIIFWISNALLFKFVKTKQFRIKDYFYISSLYYVIAFFSGIGGVFTASEYGGAAAYAIFLIVPFLISIWAIFINTLFVLSKKKK